MIIDLILDRKDGDEYIPQDFYDNIVEYEDTFNFKQDISRALLVGTNKDVQKALCDYIIDNEYNPQICDYINSVEWVED